MQTDRLLTFGPHRLDPKTGQLWRGKQEVRLTGKASVLLRYLVARAGQVVTKDELFQAVWPETVVSDAALTSCIQEVRKALKDDPKQPRYLKTIHRRGFQFVGTVASSQHSVVSRKTTASRSQESEARILSFPPQSSARSPQYSVLVGREPELAQLHGWLEKALHGERQIVFVTGEPGIGKTSLVEGFLQSLESRVQNHEERQKAKACPERSQRGKNQKTKIEDPSPTPNTQYPLPGLGGDSA
jgi:DNA-binding winged helix-turn-helix (wHTH) protein